MQGGGGANLLLFFLYGKLRHSLNGLGKLSPLEAVVEEFSRWQPHEMLLKHYRTCSIGYVVFIIYRTIETYHAL